MLKQAWLSYLAAVLPPNAPSAQVIETRRAFYAGAQALMTGILGALDPGIEPTEQDIEIMTGVQAELKTFCDQVRSGVA
jgi:hypothetical protein